MLSIAKTIRMIMRRQHYTKHIIIKNNKIIVKNHSELFKVSGSCCMDGLLALIDVIDCGHSVMIECNKGTYYLRMGNNPNDDGRSLEQDGY